MSKMPYKPQTQSPLIPTLQHFTHKGKRQTLGVFGLSTSSNLSSIISLISTTPYAC